MYSNKKKKSSVKYKGYEIIKSGVAVAVYRGNEFITTEAKLEVALDMIDRRVYSNPDFNRR